MHRGCTTSVCTLLIYLDLFYFLHTRTVLIRVAFLHTANQTLAYLAVSHRCFSYTLSIFKLVSILCDS